MAKRIVTKIGDVFCVEIDGKYKSFFQYIAKDLSYMNSSVIRAFKTRYPVDSILTLDQIINDEVSFYAHTVLRAGIHFGAWYKIGSSKTIGEEKLKKVTFAQASITDLYSTTFRGFWNPLENWYIWHVNEELKYIGKLPENYSENCEPSGVLSYIEIVSRIKYGYYKYTRVDYDVIKRVPLPDVDSYVKREKDDTVTYYHFKGKHAIRQLVISGDRITRLTEDASEADGMTLRKADFGDTNWQNQEFIDAEEFEQAWLKR